LEVIEKITGLLDTGGEKKGFHQPGGIKFRIIFKHRRTGQGVETQRTDARKQPLDRSQSFRAMLAQPGGRHTVGLRLQADAARQMMDNAYMLLRDEQYGAKRLSGWAIHSGFACLAVCRTHCGHPTPGNAWTATSLAQATMSALASRGSLSIPSGPQMNWYLEAPQAKCATFFSLKIRLVHGVVKNTESSWNSMISMFLVTAAFLAFAAAALLFLFIDNNPDVVRAEIEPLGAGQVEPFAGQIEPFEVIGQYMF
jgi:hypothetical protein